MKTILLFTIILFVVQANGQTAEFGKIAEQSTYAKYITKAGDTLSVGEHLIIGKPTADLGFTYISQGGQRVASHLSGKDVVITQLRSYGTKKSGYKLYACFKGYGLLPVLIDYDNALETGEVSNPNAKMTRDQAINKLKEAKDLMDLNMIPQSEFENIKNKLTPIILQGQ